MNCLKCGLEMHVVEIGAYMLEMGGAPGPEFPYKLYSIDIAQCPKCKSIQECGRGKPSMPHDVGFAEEVIHAKRSTEHSFYVIHERYTPKQKGRSHAKKESRKQGSK